MNTLEPIPFDRVLQQRIADREDADRRLGDAAQVVLLQVLRAEADSLPESVRHARAVLKFEAEKVIREAVIQSVHPSGNCRDVPGPTPIHDSQAKG